MRIMRKDFMEAALFAAGKARQSGVPVVVDAGTLREGMLDLARRSDCFIASEFTLSYGRSLSPGACFFQTLLPARDRLRRRTRR